MLQSFPRRRLIALLLVLGAALHCPLLLRAQSRVVIPSNAVVDENALNDVLAQGAHLEEGRRWGEALSHYERAAREFPQDNQVQARLRSARTHFDVSRRYADPSFINSLHTLNEQKAYDLLGEVLEKVHYGYVETPDWSELLQHGAERLEIALNDPVFRRTNLAGASPQNIDAFGRKVRSMVMSQPVSNRRQTQDAARRIAIAGRQELGLSPTATLMEFTAGATGALDPYSSFLTPNQLEDLFSQIEGAFVGLGVEIRADAGSLLISHVIPGSPAAESGLREGDRITKVNNQVVHDVTDKAAEMLKGPENTTVDVTVLSTNGQQRVARVLRKRIEVPSVEKAGLIDETYGIAYMRLPSFQKNTSRDVDAALWSLHRQGMRSLIIDLRGNPGGLLKASVDLADKFISQGLLVSTRGRAAREDIDYRAHELGTWRVPLVVLIDRDSASASEIFAGAIRDHARGSVVGERSYGKGSVQGIFQLGVGETGIRLTTAKFFSPKGHAISRRGVFPDVTVRKVGKPAPGGLLSEEDEVLQAGMEVARGAISRR